MISHKYKFIFIHIPRTGGTSLNHQFSSLDSTREGGKHENLNIVKSRLSPEDYQSYFKFCIVRNPWDIIVSKYLSSWYNSKQIGGDRFIGERAGNSIEHFVELMSPAAHEQGDSLLDYINIEDMDYVGRFETRRESVGIISKKIGIALDVDYHIGDCDVPNFTRKKKHYSCYYNEEGIQAVRDRYAKDIEYFGYEFEDKRYK